MCQSDGDPPPKQSLTRLTTETHLKNGASEVHSNSTTDFNQPVFVYRCQGEASHQRGEEGQGRAGWGWMPVDDTGGGLAGEDATMFEEVIQKIHQIIPLLGTGYHH